MFSIDRFSEPLNNPEGISLLRAKSRCVHLVKTTPFSPNPFPPKILVADGY